MNLRATTSRTSLCSKRRGSARTLTILRPWASSPTSTHFPPMPLRIFTGWCATTRTIFIPTRTPRRLCLPAQLVSRGIFQGLCHRSAMADNEWKFGVESDNTFLNENFSYIITDPTQFDAEHSSHISVCGEPAGSGAVCLRAGSDPLWQLDGQRGPALGSLSTAVEPASGGSAVRSFALFPFCRP